MHQVLHGVAAAIIVARSSGTKLKEDDYYAQNPQSQNLPPTERNA